MLDSDTETKKVPLPKIQMGGVGGIFKPFSPKFREERPVTPETELIVNYDKTY